MYQVLESINLDARAPIECVFWKKCGGISLPHSYFSIPISLVFIPVV
jgi:hypothetical protein